MHRAAALIFDGVLVGAGLVGFIGLAFGAAAAARAYLTRRGVGLVPVANDPIPPRSDLATLFRMMRDGGRDAGRRWLRGVTYWNLVDAGMPTWQARAFTLGPEGPDRRVVLDVLWERKGEPVAAPEAHAGG